MAIGITALGTKKVKDERANLKISKDTAYDLQLLKLTNKFKSVDELLKDMIEVYKHDKAGEENTSK
jgi:hypothetical protein